MGLTFAFCLCSVVIKALKWVVFEILSWDRRPVWARGHCRISPPRFLAECCKRQLNQGSFVLLYFRLSTFSDLYWVCLSVFSCTVLFFSISQVIGCEDRLRNDLYCVEWGVKLYSSQDPCTRRRAVQSYVRLLWPLVWRIAGVLLSLASLLRIMLTRSMTSGVPQRRRIRFERGFVFYAQFTPPARQDKTIMSVSYQVVWTESRYRLAKSEQSADRSPSSSGV